MSDQGEPLARIAAALERLAPPAVPVPDWNAAPAYVWDQHGARAVARIVAPPLDLLQGIDEQKQRVVDNVARLAAGHAAHTTRRRNWVRPRTSGRGRPRRPGAGSTGRAGGRTPWGPSG